MISLSRVSIIVPAFNAALYLEETVQSVRAQTHENWLLWIVDDGSSDQTLQIARDLAALEARIRVLSQENGGQASARNMALRQCQDDWIAFLDSDDLWAPQKLEIQLAAQQKSGADVVFCGGVIFLDDLSENTSDYPTQAGIFSGAQMGPILVAGNPIQNSSVLARRACIAKVGFLDEDRALQNAEDFDLWFRLAHAGAVFQGLSDSLSHYRRHANASTALAINMHRPEIAVLERHWQKSGAPHSMAKKRIRAASRALAAALLAQGRFAEARTVLDDMGTRWDKVGPLTLLQRVLVRVCPHAFNRIVQPIYDFGDQIKKFEKRLRR